MSGRAETGKLIVFEGVDRVGKSTLARCLVSRLNDGGVESEYAAFPGKHPGTIGRVVYDIHHCPAKLGIEKLSSASLQALHIASHLDVIERSILRTLARGRWVVLDRFWWSTRVYGLAAGVEPNILDAMIHVERLLWKGTAPAMLFLIERTDAMMDSDCAVRHREYRALCRSERDRYPVCVIRNDSSISESVDGLLTVLHGRFDALKAVETSP